MNNNDMKEAYKSGEWICVRKVGVNNTWQVHSSPNFGISEPRILIHKKHKGVLDHVLNGGAVEIKLEKVTVVKETVEEFISTYKESFNYEIIKDKPKPVERITREEAKDKYVGWYIDDVIDKLFDYIEYLEANQKEK